MMMIFFTFASHNNRALLLTRFIIIHTRRLANILGKKKMNAKKYLIHFFFCTILNKLRTKKKQEWFIDNNYYNT